jgi:hypothetical protein
MSSKLIGLIVGLIAIFMVLLGALSLLSKKKPYYINEGFTDEKLLEYPTDPLTELKNPIIKIVKKLGNMSAYFVNPQAWLDVYKTSNMSLAELARANIKKEKAAAAAAAASS